MTAKEISQDVLKKIEAQNIAPRPRWHFILRNIVVWMIAVFCIVFGALTVSLMIFIFTHGAWEARGIIDRGPFEHFFAVFPLLWLISFILFIVLADYAVRATKMGYKYSTGVLALIIIVTSVIGGMALHIIGVSQHTDKALGQHVPYYKTVEMQQNRFLHIPEKGQIVGRVINVGEDTFVIYNPIVNEEYVVIQNGTETIGPSEMIQIDKRAA